MSPFPFYMCLRMLGIIVSRRCQGATKRASPAEFFSEAPCLKLLMDMGLVCEPQKDARGSQMGPSGLLHQVFGGAVLAEDASTDRQLVLEGLYLCA